MMVTDIKRICKFTQPSSKDGKPRFPEKLKNAKFRKIQFFKYAVVTA